MKEIDNQIRENIWKDSLRGLTVQELADKYGVTNIQVATAIYDNENRDEKAIAERYLKCKKMRDINAKTKKAVDDAINAGQDLDTISEIYDIRYDSLEDYYIENYLKAIKYANKLDAYKHRYFAGESISSLKKDTEFFDSEFASILDKQAIFEDFRSGMTLPELVEMYGRDSIDDVGFTESNVKVDIGKRYGEAEILKIIVSKIAKGE